ncbi:hypothetical protein [Pseudomonas sp. UMAB-08]|nr:hypothetical protein [Pseudomonas sp. UMAB-08]
MSDLLNTPLRLQKHLAINPLRNETLPHSTRPLPLPHPRLMR